MTHERDNYGRDRGTALRMLLEREGIKLPDPAPPPAPPPPRTRYTPPTEHRDAIREILIDRGARAGDVEWLTASCPGVAAARAFAPYRDLTPSVLP